MSKIGVLRNRTVTGDGYVQWTPTHVCECDNQRGPSGGVCLGCGGGIPTVLERETIAAFQANEALGET